MIWYKASKWYYKIEEIEIEKTTSHFVFMKNRRESIVSDSYFWCATRQEAKDKLVDYLEKSAERARDTVKYAEDKVKIAKSL